MTQAAATHSRAQRKKLLYSLLMCALCLMLNLLGALLANRLHLPLYLDSIGTLLAVLIGGAIPGAVVGYLSNLISGLIDSSNLYYGLVNLLIALFAALFVKNGWFKRLPTIIASIFVFALIGGGLGSLLTWVVYGFEGSVASASLAGRIYQSSGLNVFFSQLLADFLVDLADKAVVVLLALLLYHLMPSALRERLTYRPWQQNPLNEAEKAAVKKNTPRTISLRAKIMALVSVALLLIAVASISISFSMLHQMMIDTQTSLCESVASIAANAIDGDRVDAYLAQGESAAGYLETEKVLAGIQQSSPDIQYVYAYKIMEDGCHVVFDPDTEDLEGEDPGTIIPFDQAFMDYLPALLAGDAIVPVISNETYGWLLTIYQPVYDQNGRCACYAAVDISMNHLRAHESTFLSKSAALFVAFFILILVLGLWLAEYGLIYPINSMALAASRFAYDNDAIQEESIENIHRLGISTGDEIEHLYRAICKTSKDTVRYINDVKTKNATIARMQDSLITVLADMVESRDQYTGNHVRNTAAYSAIIMEQLKKEHIYTDILTDEFVHDVIHSAPLHDVGKIHVSDMLLNKPGRLTDEEFKKMKDHTIAGQQIIARAVSATSDSSYLKEAQNLAAYHHERWDGKGYPYGLKGEDIPLSARIMAVADVFDALVSRRSYKEGFSVEKAMGIIREGIGTHFDPQVATAFLHAEAEARRIAEDQSQDT